MLPIVGEIGLAKCKCLSHVEMSWESENCTLCMQQEEFNGHVAAILKQQGKDVEVLRQIVNVIEAVIVYVCTQREREVKQSAIVYGSRRRARINEDCLMVVQPDCGLS